MNISILQVIENFRCKISNIISEILQILLKLLKICNTVIINVTPNIIMNHKIIKCRII